MDVIDDLMRNAPVVLQHVVVCAAHCRGDLFGDGEDGFEFGVRHVVQFYGVGFGDYKLLWLRSGGKLVM